MVVQMTRLSVQKCNMDSSTTNQYDFGKPIRSYTQYCQSIFWVISSDCCCVVIAVGQCVASSTFPYHFSSFDLITSSPHILCDHISMLTCCVQIWGRLVSVLRVSGTRINNFGVKRPFSGFERWRPVKPLGSFQSRTKKPTQVIVSRLMFILICCLWILF